MAQNDSVNVWIGSGQGIYQFSLDTLKGEMSEAKQVAELNGAGFLELHPSGKTLYSTGSDKDAGVVVAYRVSGDKLIELNRVETGDSRSSHVSVDHNGQLLFSAQYHGGSISMYRLSKDGSIESRLQMTKHNGGSGVVNGRQDSPHPHWAGVGPNNKFLYVPDLGIDAVFVYEITQDANSGQTKLVEIEQAKLGPGSGPRHLKFSNDGERAYVFCEMTLNVSAMRVDSKSGKLNFVANVASLPRDEWDSELNSGAEIRVHPNGKFVYASNRGHDSITVFAVENESGKLNFVQREAIRGSWPRNFALDPSGKWLLAAGAFSNTVSLFKVDDTTGKLTFTRKVINVPKPVCVLMEYKKN